MTTLLEGIYWSYSRLAGKKGLYWGYIHDSFPLLATSQALSSETPNQLVGSYFREYLLTPPCGNTPLGNTSLTKPLNGEGGGGMRGGGSLPEAQVSIQRK